MQLGITRHRRCHSRATEQKVDHGSLSCTFLPFSGNILNKCSVVQGIKPYIFISSAQDFFS